MSPVVPGGLGGGAGRRPAGGGGQHRATPHTRRERRGRGGRTKAPPPCSRVGPGLILHLDDVYWTEEGRRSVEVVVLTASLV
ncbi:hypothetical protein AB0932_29860, partial [Streptomyces sp. NPDC006682]